MTELDQALQAYMQDDDGQSDYYDLVLNSDLYLATVEDDAPQSGAVAENDTISPVILESEGKTYLMLFDSEERLTAWAGKPTPYVVLPGHAIAQMTPAAFHWAVNIGTDFAKEFVPDEIAWLCKVVKECEEQP